MGDNYEFPNARKNPFAGTFNGKYTVIVEHEDRKELVKLDYNKTPPSREVLEVIPVVENTTKQQDNATAI